MERIEEIRKRHAERKYVVTIMGQDHLYAHTDIRYLLSLIDRYREEMENWKNNLEKMSAGEFYTILEYTPIQSYQKYAGSLAERIDKVLQGKITDSPTTLGNESKE